MLVVFASTDDTASWQSVCLHGGIFAYYTALAEVIPYPSSRLSSLAGSLVVPLAARDGSELTGARNLLEGDSWVICVLEPIKAPLATGLEVLGEGLALVTRRDAAVLCSRQTTELRAASIEQTDAASRDEEIEVVATEVTAGIGRLNDHGLASNGAGCESQAGMSGSASCSEIGYFRDLRIACAAPAGLALAADGRSSETVGRLVIDSPWGVVGASVGAASVTAARGVRVRQGRVVGVAGQDRLANGCLSRPGATRFAAVPVASGLS